MSKGIGAGYIERMRRYHVPHIRDPRVRISFVCDRAFYHEGAFKYKLPRYFRDMLYRKKFPCEQLIYNKKKKCCETKIVYRYKSKNLLALQMQAEIRNRILANYRRAFEETRLQHPDWSDTQIDFELLRIDKASRFSRFQNTYIKMSRFYKANRNKTRLF